MSKLFLILLTIALLWIGGQASYTAITNLSPSEFEISEYIEKKPSAKWLKLTGGRVFIPEAVCERYFGVSKPTEAYVPLFPADSDVSDVNRKIHVLLATKDSRILELVDIMINFTDESNVEEFAINHADELYYPRDVKGLVRFGIEMQNEDERRLRKLNPNLSENFIVIDEGKRPEYEKILALPLGIALALFLLRRFIKREEVKPPPSPGVPPPLPNR